MDQLSSNEFKFDDFFLNADGILSFHGNEMAIPPKELHVLITLLESQGSLIKKDDLIEQVWGDYPVGDESLTRCIYSLRRLLRESKNNKYIETIYGKGYRFCKAVTVIARRSTPRSHIKIAVLPLRGAGEEGTTWQAALLDHLAQAQLPGVNLVPAALAHGPLDVEDILALCQQLSLDYYLTGEVSLHDAKRVVQIEWVDASDHHLIHRETITQAKEAPLSALLETVVSFLPQFLPNSSITAAEPIQQHTTAQHNEVVLAHMMARRCLRLRSRNELRTAQQYLQMALLQNPQHIPSLVALAETYLARTFQGELWPQMAFEQAQTALKKALALLPDHSGALSVYAWLSALQQQGDAKSVTHTPSSHTPNQALPEFYLYQAMQHSVNGEFDASLHSLEQSLASDHDLAPAQLFKMWLLNTMGQRNEALAYGLSIAEQGVQTAQFYGLLALLLALQGRLDEALDYLQEGHNEDRHSALLGQFYYAMVWSFKDRSHALKQLQAVAASAHKRYRCPGLWVILALQLKEHKTAKYLLQLAQQQGCVWFSLLRVSPMMSAFVSQ